MQLDIGDRVADFGRDYASILIPKKGALDFDNRGRAFDGNVLYAFLDHNGVVTKA